MTITFDLTTVLILVGLFPVLWMSFYLFRGFLRSIVEDNVVVTLTIGTWAIPLIFSLNMFLIAGIIRAIT